MSKVDPINADIHNPSFFQELYFIFRKKTIIKRFEEEQIYREYKKIKETNVLGFEYLIKSVHPSSSLSFYKYVIENKKDIELWQRKSELDKKKEEQRKEAIKYNQSIINHYAEIIQSDPLRAKYAELYLFLNCTLKDPILRKEFLLSHIESFDSYCKKQATFDKQEQLIEEWIERQSDFSIYCRELRDEKLEICEGIQRDVLLHYDFDEIKEEDYSANFWFFYIYMYGKCQKLIAAD